MVLLCILACVCRQLYLFANRSRGRFTPSPRAQSERVQLPYSIPNIHGPVVQAEAVSGSSEDRPPTPSFMNPRPVVEGQMTHESLASILKKQSSPDKTPHTPHDSMMSDESSLWGAWNGHELTDEQIDMMVREAEAKQRGQQVRQHLMNEGRLTTATQPRPWWKPEGGPSGRLSPQHSTHASDIGPISDVQTISRLSSATMPPIVSGDESGETGAPSSSHLPMHRTSSPDHIVQGVSMLQPQKTQSLGPASSSKRRSSGERGVQSMGLLATPHTKPRHSSLGSDGGRSIISLKSPENVISGRDITPPITRDQATPQSVHQQVTTPGNWSWSPTNQRSMTPPNQRSMTPPNTSLRVEPPVSTAQRRVHQSVPGSLRIGGTVGLSGVSQQGTKTPPESDRSAVIVPPLPQFSQLPHQQHGTGTTPPPTPPTLIRANRAANPGQQVVVPPIWRNTPPTSRSSTSQDIPRLRSPTAHRNFTPRNFTPPSSDCEPRR